jgi:AcrR family transcriptional regulator
MPDLPLAKTHIPKDEALGVEAAPSYSRVSARRKGDNGTRQQILISAMKWFARRGYEGASVTQIAADIGVPQPLINYHFAGKQGLWTAVVDFLFEELLSKLDFQSASLKDLTPLDALKVTLRRSSEFVLRRPEFFMIAMLEIRDDTDRRRYLLERYIGPLNEQMAKLIRAAQDSRQIKRLPVLNLLDIMVGVQIVFYGKSAAFPFSDCDGEETGWLTEKHPDVLIEVLFDGLMV